jgi:hypothetical protein
MITTGDKMTPAWRKDEIFHSTRIGMIIQNNRRSGRQRLSLLSCLALD